MYWDSLTAVGIFVSIVLVLFAFYLELRKRPTVQRNNPQQTWPPCTIKASSSREPVALAKSSTSIKQRQAGVHWDAPRLAHGDSFHP